MAIIKVVESDQPKSLGEKLAEYLARPPKPILRLYGPLEVNRDSLSFSVRNGLPLPLVYGVYISTDRGDYMEKTDHIGPFSTDNWRVDFTHFPEVVSVKLGLVPFEILTDKMSVRL